MEASAAQQARPSLSTTDTVDDSRYKWKVLASVVVGLFMVILDATVVNVALRALTDEPARISQPAEQV